MISSPPLPPILHSAKIEGVGTTSDDLLSIKMTKNDMISQYNELNVEEISKEPKLGQEFISADDAYTYYTRYAGKLGFKVRKYHHSKNSKGVVSRVVFCCSKQGFRQPDKRVETASFHKPDSRIGCLAKIACLLQNNGNFKIVSCCTTHNHNLIESPAEHLLNINRSISRVQKPCTKDVDKSVISVKRTLELMSREIGGPENSGITDKDYRNCIHSKRKFDMKKGDAGTILHYLEKMKSQDSSFFYSIQLDEEDKITNIFWADTRSISDYGLFGDVVFFDTTYRTNEYDRPFTPLVGVNHHKQMVIFGAGLLYDETVDSFKWLFKTFLTAMGGQEPATILTDQSAAMASAISQVFCGTRHRLCVWHIYQNAAKTLSHVFNGSKDFDKDFSKCLYDYEDKDEWLLAWSKMLEIYDLKDNNWLKSLFELKEKWAMVYGHHTFTADMISAQRSESMNNMLKKYLKPNLDFFPFFEHFEKVLKDRRYEELCDDLEMTSAKPVIIINTAMLQYGVEVYTPEMFKLFQAEYMKSLNYDAWKIKKDGSTSTYRVCYASPSKEHFVTFEVLTQTITCSCMKFTFLGILCAHALKVLDKKNVKFIPLQYIKKRWSRQAKDRSISNYDDDINIYDDPKESIGRRYSHLCRNFREIATYASEDDKLAVYAHESLVHLLHNLENMKKNYFMDAIIDSNLHAPLEENAVTTPAAVEIKAIVGSPKGHLKDPLEKRRPKSEDQIVEATKKAKTLVSISYFSLNEHEIDSRQEPQVFYGLIQSSLSNDNDPRKTNEG